MVESISECGGTAASGDRNLGSSETAAITAAPTTTTADVHIAVQTYEHDHVDNKKYQGMNKHIGNKHTMSNWLLINHYRRQNPK